MNENFYKNIEYMVSGLWQDIGIDRPSNHDDIVRFIAEDVEDAADPNNWTSEDILIAFRRWIEKNK